MREAVPCHVHVARERRKESLQPFIRGRVCKISDKDLETRGEARGDRRGNNNDILCDRALLRLCLARREARRSR